MKQVIIIRKDLKMRRGKEIAQGSHASCKFLIDILQNGGRLTSAQMYWVANGQKKICLQATSEQQLLDLYDSARGNGLISSIITDAGHTEFNGVPTITALAIGPGEDDLIDIITGSLQLY